MEISPRYTSDSWFKLKLTVTSPDKDWKKAVEIFDDRYSNRFINPIDALKNNSKINIWVYSGFSIMAINCLLIETFNQFYYGVKDTDAFKSDESICHINSIEDSFVDFFCRSKNFSSDFDIKKAKIFYKQIRCGLLHQAETKKTSRIHIKKEQKELIIVENEDQPNEGISIRRDIFTDRLFQEYDDYKKRLLKIPFEPKLRINFIKKMNYICDDKI